MLQCCSATGKCFVFGFASRCVFVSQATICTEGGVFPGENTEQRRELKSEQMQSNSETPGSWSGSSCGPPARMLLQGWIQM